MGMIGAQGLKAMSEVDPSQLSTRQKIMLFGAALKDAGAGMQGRDSEAFLNTQAMISAQAQKAKHDAFVQQLMGAMQPTYQDAPAPQLSVPPVGTPGLIGGQAQATQDAAAPPIQVGLPTRTSDGMTMGDPRLPALALAAPEAGVNMAGLLEVLKAQQPHLIAGPNGELFNDKSSANEGRVLPNRTNINGWVTDLNDPKNTGQFFPQLPTGMIPDGKGGVGNPTGLVPALADQKQAEATGTTKGSMLTVPLSGGGSRLMLGSDYLSGGGGKGAAGPGLTTGGAGGPGDGLGTAPSPQDTAYRTDRANDAAARYKGMQSAGEAAPNAISRLQAMRGLLKDYEGGHYAPALLDMASAANSLGFPMDAKMKNAQVAQALSAQMTLELMKNPDTGGNMFPRITNFEMQTFQKAVPGLMQSAQGRDKLVSMYSAIQQRAQDVAGMARQWDQHYGRIDAPDATGKTFQDRLEAWSKQHPLFAGIKGAR